MLLSRSPVIRWSEKYQGKRKKEKGKRKKEKEKEKEKEKKKRKLGYRDLCLS